MAIVNISHSDLVSLLGEESQEPILPARSGLEVGVSPSTEEYVALCQLLHFSRPEIIFEFGTCVGGSTRVFALNAPRAKVFSIDLYAPRTDGTIESEANLARIADRDGGSLVRGMPNVFLLRGDSRTYDYSKIPPCDFVFIDGGHDEETARSDSENAFRMLNPRNPRATIAWHDCAPDLPISVDRLTQEFSEARPIFGVLGLTLRFYSPALVGKAPLAAT
jgi:predicted O-methyltransferase YrrM